VTAAVASLDWAGSGARSNSLAKAAEAALNLDLRASRAVGDRLEDIGLAEPVGASAIYLGDGSASARVPGRFPSPTFTAPFILERVAV